MVGLPWLPVIANWRDRFRSLPKEFVSADELRELAGYSIDFVQTAQLDKRLRDAAHDLPTLRLALLASCTVEQLVPSLRVAALRRGYLLEVLVAEYGQYRQIAFGSESELYRFNPDVVVFCFDAPHVVGTGFISGPAAAMDAVNQRMTEIRRLWEAVRSNSSCQIIQQSLIPRLPNLLGSAEHLAPGSPSRMVDQFNASLEKAAAAAGVNVFALDRWVRVDGVEAWFSPSLWHRAKQEVSPAAAPLWAELLFRVVGAQRGRSSKCIVLDLDNTLWSGVIGDDGLEGIELGQGSAAGEAFIEFQQYVKALSARGIIVALCSKNDEANGLEPFKKHPDMILREPDIAAFQINWDDKATNLRRIASDLNIGLDSMVFVDDNPFERNIVRREIPEVAVPELPDDPALWSSLLSSAGYFESVSITNEDLDRSGSYQSSKALRKHAESQTDLQGYLASLEMRLSWQALDPLSLKRVTQLVNKTNQFNLTTRRYTEAEMAAMMRDPNVVALHFRLTDKYADHGIISVVIARYEEGGVLEIDSWLMSCRVLGRQVEQAVFAVIAEIASSRGSTRIVGRFSATQKNGIVRDHYARLGFQKAEESEAAGTWVADIPMQANAPEVIEIKEVN